MLCRDCQDKLRKDFDEHLSRLTPAQQAGAQGKRLVAIYRMLAEAKCKHTGEIAEIALLS